jgi:hypothetical protein
MEGTKRIFSPEVTSNFESKGISMNITITHHSLEFTPQVLLRMDFDREWSFSN